MNFLIIEDNEATAFYPKAIKDIKPNSQDSVVWLPSFLFNFINLTIPVNKRSLVAKTIPFIIKDKIIGDLEENHWIFNFNQQTGETNVVLIKKVVFEKWLTKVKTIVNGKITMYPDIFLLPYKPKIWSVYICKQFIRVRTGENSGFYLPIKMIDLLKVNFLTFNEKYNNEYSLEIYSENDDLVSEELKNNVVRITKFVDLSCEVEYLSKQNLITNNYQESLFKKLNFIIDLKKFKILQNNLRIIGISVILFFIAIIIDFLNLNSKINSYEKSIIVNSQKLLPNIKFSSINDIILTSEKIAKLMTIKQDLIKASAWQEVNNFLDSLKCNKCNLKTFKINNNNIFLSLEALSTIKLANKLNNAKQFNSQINFTAVRNDITTIYNITISKTNKNG